MKTGSQRSRKPWKHLNTVGFTLLMGLWIILSLDLIWPAISNVSNSPSKTQLPEPDGPNYLIIATQALRKSTSAWAEYRRSTGYQTQVNILAPSQVKEAEIRDLIQKTYLESGKPNPFHVLLIGHAHRFSSHPDTFLPAAQFLVHPKQFSSFGADPIAADDGYASVDPSGIPDHVLPIFIGRIPVRTEEEGFLLLERTKSYERKPPTGEGRARIELVVSNAGFGPQYDPLFDWALRTLIQDFLPDQYQWHILNGNAKSPYSYPIHSFPNEVAERFDSGALAVVYIGHGQPDLLGWAYSPDGEPGRIFNLEDTELIQNANDSLGIFTACSAGTYDLDGDGLSVVESIILTPGGPVATYSSSAWINGAMNGRLIIDIFESLLIDRASTLGEWMNSIESGSESRSSRHLFTSVVRAFIPRISGVYQNNPLLSRTEANQELDIQHATYNLFGDPALRIAYPRPGLEVSSHWLWQPWKGSLAFHGNSNLSAGQQVSISLEVVPGDTISRGHPFAGTRETYLQANDTLIQRVNTTIEKGGIFSGKIDLPQDASGGQYLLRAVAVQNGDTYVATHPVYIGGPSIKETLFSAVFWWALVSMLFLSKTHILH